MGLLNLIFAPKIFNDSNILDNFEFLSYTKSFITFIPKLLFFYRK